MLEIDMMGYYFVCLLITGLLVFFISKNAKRMFTRLTCRHRSERTEVVRLKTSKHGKPKFQFNRAICNDCGRFRDGSLQGYRERKRYGMAARRSKSKKRVAA